MRPLILTDLDDTLFQTIRDDTPAAADLRVMSKLSDGSPSGYATKQQQHFLSWLRVGHVIPVTARSADVLARVKIEQAPAIVSNGGCIRSEEGAFDQDWHDQLVLRSTQGERVEDIYHVIVDKLDRRAFRHWIVSENGLPLYIVIKSNTRDEQALAGLAQSLATSLPEGWRRHSNGNNLAFLPQWLNKRHAVSYFINRQRALHPDQPIIGIGDSVSDAGFMDLCDFAMVPSRSQLWRSIVEGNEWAA